MKEIVVGHYRLPVTILQVSVDRSGVWLAAGWKDFLRAPGISLAYGAVVVAMSYMLTFGFLQTGLGSLVLPLAGGFLLLGPILAIGLYDVSRRLENGQPIRLRAIRDACLGNAGQIAAMGVVLLIVFYVWVVIALFIFALFFNQNPPALESFVSDVVFSLKGAPFLIVGSAVGALLAATVFAITAVSIPMLLDLEVDVITAIAISMLAVRANWQVMAGWAAMIALVAGVGLATFFIGLLVAFPLLGYATWHAYRDLVAVER